MTDEAMQLIVEIAAMNPMEVHQGGDCCYFCGVDTDFDHEIETLVVNHVPFCTWLRCMKLAAPWLDENQKRMMFGGLIHREAVAT